MRAADDLCSGPAYLEGIGFYARQAEACTCAREAAARLIKADPDDLALTQNTTQTRPSRPPPSTPDAWCRSTPSRSALAWR
jgi:hypothetical protein